MAVADHVVSCRMKKSWLTVDMGKKEDSATRPFASRKTTKLCRKLYPFLRRRAMSRWKLYHIRRLQAPIWRFGSVRIHPKLGMGRKFTMAFKARHGTSKKKRLLNEVPQYYPPPPPFILKPHTLGTQMKDFKTFTSWLFLRLAPEREGEAKQSRNSGKGSRQCRAALDARDARRVSQYSGTTRLFLKKDRRARPDIWRLFKTPSAAYVDADRDGFLPVCQGGGEWGVFWAPRDGIFFFL